MVGKIVLVIGLLSSLITIFGAIRTQFLTNYNGKNRLFIFFKKWIFLLNFGLAIIISGSFLIYSIESEKEKVEELTIEYQVELEAQSFRLLAEDANRISKAIVVSGYETFGELYNELATITNYYGRHTNIFNGDYEHYKAELDNWKIIMDKVRNGVDVDSQMLNELMGQVSSASAQLKQIAEDFK